MSALRPVASVLLASGLLASAAAEPAPPSAARPVLRVGIDDGDLRGADGAALQAAIDRVAALGGGTVRIGPGRYLLRNALALRSGVDDGTFRISAPLYLDYMMEQGASASLVFPAVGGWQVRNVTLEGLTIDGNRGKTVATDGCRSGGLYLFECGRVAIRSCVVRGHHHGLVFRDNTIGNAAAGGPTVVGLAVGPFAKDLVQEENRFTNVRKDVAWEETR